MKLHGEQCLLCPYTEKDAEALATLGNNRSLWLNLTNVFPHPYTLDDAKDWIARSREIE